MRRRAKGLWQSVQNLCFCRAWIAENDFPQLFKRLGSCRIPCSHYHLDRSCGEVLRHSGDDLAWLVDGKPMGSFYFRSIFHNKEDALLSVFLIDFEFFSFDDDVISYCERAVFQSCRRVRNRSDSCARLLCAQNLNADCLKYGAEVGGGYKVDRPLVDFFVIGGVFSLRVAGRRKNYSYNVSLFYRRPTFSLRKTCIAILQESGSCLRTPELFCRL